MKILTSSTTTTSKVDLSALILRLVGGSFMLYAHGLPKLNNLLSGDEIQFVSLFGMGASFTLALVVFAELICALALVLGLFTRWVVIPLIFTMVYAAFIYHANDGFGAQEKPILFLAIYVVILLLGPGKYALDRALQKRNKTI